MSVCARPARRESTDTISASPNHTPRGFDRRCRAPMRQANSNTLEPNSLGGRSLEISAAAHAEKQLGVAFHGETACRVNLRTSTVAKCPRDGNVLRSQASRANADRKERREMRCAIGTNGKRKRRIDSHLNPSENWSSCARVSGLSKGDISSLL